MPVLSYPVHYRGRREGDDWLPGDPKRTPTAADLSRVGELAAGLYDHAERYRPHDVPALPRWDWPFGPSAPLWKEGEAFYSAEELAVFGEASARSREDLERLGQGKGTFGLVHRDLTLGNLLFGGRDGVPPKTVGATDFDQSGLGYYLFDLSVVLRALRPLWRRAGYRPDLTEGRAREALFAGYERAGLAHKPRTLSRHFRRDAKGGCRQQEPAVARLEGDRRPGAREGFPARFGLVAGGELPGVIYSPTSAAHGAVVSGRVVDVTSVGRV
jgi:hypothetical protein